MTEHVQLELDIGSVFSREERREFGLNGGALVEELSNGNVECRRIGKLLLVMGVGRHTASLASWDTGRRRSPRSPAPLQASRARQEICRSSWRAVPLSPRRFS